MGRGVEFPNGCGHDNLFHVPPSVRKAVEGGHPELTRGRCPAQASEGQLPSSSRHRPAVNAALERISSGAGTFHYWFILNL